MKDNKYKKYVSKTCKEIYCLKSPSFGYEGGIREYCIKHKLKNMKNLTIKNCNEKNCSKIGSYFFKGKCSSEDVVYCRKHKLPNMVNKKIKTCTFENCIKKATYRYSNEKYFTKCLEHSDLCMIPYGKNKCAAERCIRRKCKILDYNNIFCSAHSRIYNFDNCIDIFTENDDFIEKVVL